MRSWTAFSMKKGLLAFFEEKQHNEINKTGLEKRKEKKIIVILGFFYSAVLTSLFTSLSHLLYYAVLIYFLTYFYLILHSTEKETNSETLNNLPKFNQYANARDGILSQVCVT